MKWRSSESRTPPVVLVLLRKPNRTRIINSDENGIKMNASIGEEKEEERVNSSDIEETKRT